MPVMAEETFGPVAAVMAVDDDDEAVRVANATRYGLGASVWSRDPEHALAVGRRITSGALFVNTVVASDPRLPFGGTKRSGYGRELGQAGAPSSPTSGPMSSVQVHLPQDPLLSRLDRSPVMRPPAGRDSSRVPVSPRTCRCISAARSCDPMVTEDRQVVVKEST